MSVWRERKLLDGWVESDILKPGMWGTRPGHITVTLRVNPGSQRRDPGHPDLFEKLMHLWWTGSRRGPSVAYAASG